MSPQVILGLGTNMGDRFQNLRDALAALRKIVCVEKTSSLYYSEAQLLPDASAAWNQPFINMAVACQTKLTPHELLHGLKNIEEALGRKNRERWSPRIIDIDILTWGNLQLNSENLSIPHKRLHERAFALLPLLELNPKWPHAEIKDHLGTHRLPHRLEKPILVGILNLTPDSFSDGGEYNTIEKSLAQAKALFGAGAEIIDLGAESTRPHATLLSPNEEWSRLQPTLEALHHEYKNLPLKPKLSIDTRHVATAEKAMHYSIDWINDVSGECSQDFAALLRGTSLHYVIMHNLGIPANPKVIIENTSATETVYQFGMQQLEKLQQAGLRKEQLIFDVGIGFGKSAEQSLELIQKIDEFYPLNLPLMIGHSRKSFLKLITDHSAHNRDIETAIISTQLAKAGVHYLRVHDVAINQRALHTANFLNR